MRPFLVILLPLLIVAAAASTHGATIDEIVTMAYTADSTKHAQISDLTMMVESYTRKLDGDDKVKEEKRFLKKYYYRDSRFHEQLLEYYLENERQDQKALEDQIKDNNERRKKGRMRDASIDPMKLFYPDRRGDYDFALIGDETREGYDCWHITADCNVEDENMMEGDFWIEKQGGNVAYCDFHPAKMPSKIKNLDMQRQFIPTESGFWLPTYFHLKGNGKVMIFIKFNFEVEEYYQDYDINTGFDDAIFEEHDK